MTTVFEPRLSRDPAPQSSDRSFGLVFAAVFALVACWPLVHVETPRWWALGVAVVIAAIALIQPKLLHYLNVAWLALGHLMHSVVSPLVMVTIFLLCVTPIGWIMRWRGKDLLALKRRPDLKSYWIDREQAPYDAQSMKNQY
jgi:predicted membrane metal-binding protein